MAKLEGNAMPLSELHLKGVQMYESLGSIVRVLRQQTRSRLAKNVADARLVRNLAKRRRFLKVCRRTPDAAPLFAQLCKSKA
jgi:hypothetical protein